MTLDAAVRRDLDDMITESQVEYYPASRDSKTLIRREVAISFKPSF
jgi:hypothetical protein